MPETDVGFYEYLPSGSSAIKLGDDDIRSNFTAIARGLDAEHYFAAGSDGDNESQQRGLHRKGSARAYVDVESRDSASGSSEAGKLYFASNTSRLFVTPESTSFTGVLVGSIRHLEVLEIRGQTSGSTDYNPVMEAGVGAGGTNVAFEHEYDIQPIVVVSAAGAGTYAYTSSVTSGGFAAETGVATGGDFNWMSIGTESLGK